MRPQAAAIKLAVDDATATASKVDVYVANLSGFVAEYEYDPVTKTATKVGEITEDLNEPASVATGPEGNVYVGSFAHGEPGKAYVNEYSPAGTLIANELVKGLTVPESIAVDAAGNIYVASGVGALKCSNTGGPARRSAPRKWRNPTTESRSAQKATCTSAWKAPRRTPT